jgi:hypothetical protein
MTDQFSQVRHYLASCGNCEHYLMPLCWAPLEDQPMPVAYTSHEHNCHFSPSRWTERAP